MITSNSPSIELSPFKLLLADRVRTHRKAIFEWQMAHTRIAPPPFYSSIDLRDSGHKIAPVDSNLFPAGFNNICPEDHRTAPPILRAQLEAIASRLHLTPPQKILILPESHTTNLYYAENLAYLIQILTHADFEVVLGWLGGSEPVTLKTQSGKQLTAHSITVNQGILRAGAFEPDFIISNNDFSNVYPAELDHVKQPILPSHRLGWHTRKKSDHFLHYNRLAKEFAELIGIDPWLIQVATEEVTPVNFNEEIGIQATADAVQRILDQTQAAYERHQIEKKPFAFIKNNSGTYGMGIMVVSSADEVLKMNRRTKNKMSIGKGKSAIHSVVVQEGIATATLVDRLPAEPVIYLAGGELIGGFLRTNTERGAEDNLNSQGMVFKKLCMSELREYEAEGETSEPMLELVYGTIARISALAAGKESL